MPCPRIEVPIKVSVANTKTNPVNSPMMISERSAPRNTTFSNTINRSENAIKKMDGMVHPTIASTRLPRASFCPFAVDPRLVF